MQIGTAGLHFPDLRKKGLSRKSPWISVKHDAESVNRTKYDRLKTKNENSELSAKRFPKFGERFAKLQRLARSSGNALQNCRGLREVRESLCKIAEACAKFGNRFAKLQRLARSSGIGLQNCRDLREVRESVCKKCKACAKFGNRFAFIFAYRNDWGWPAAVRTL